MAPRKFVGPVLLIAIVVGASPEGGALAQEPAERGELLRALETVNLSREDKALLRAKAAEAVRAGVAEDEVAGLIQRGADHRVPAAELGQLLDVVAQARRQDLPVGPVLDKVKEGLAKRVPSERIVTAASRISRDLATSRDLVRRAEREGVRVEALAHRAEAIEAVADALGRGVPPRELEGLARQVARSTRREATMVGLGTAAQVTADLVAMGLSPHDASETVGAAMAQGLGRRDVERLRERLAQELRRGGSPEEGGKRLRDDIRSERPDRDQDRDGSRGRDRPGRDGVGERKPGRH